MYAIASILLGYLIGTINPAYIFGKYNGFDIRSHGSKNAGASNAVILMGKSVGAVCAAADIFKAYFSYRLAGRLFAISPIAGLLAGCGCILGHIFPVWMKFRGGKGLACLCGVVLAHNWRLFLLMLTFELVVVLAFGYICLVAMTASVIFPVIYSLSGGELLGILALSLIAVVMLSKHIENVRRIFQGKELRLSFLWNREKELKRLKEQCSQ